MPTTSINRSASALGRSFTGNFTATGDNGVLTDPSLAAAKTGTVTTYTNGTTGTLTMTAGHGITTGAKIDLYWSGGQASFTVGTVATNSVPIASGTGDALPAVDTAITAMVKHVEPHVLTIADVIAQFVSCDNVACTATFLDGSDAVIGVVRVRASDLGNEKHYIWDSTNGGDPAASDDVASVAVTHADSTQARTVVVASLYN